MGASSAAPCPGDAVPHSHGGGGASGLQSLGRWRGQHIALITAFAASLALLAAGCSLFRGKEAHS